MRLLSLVLVAATALIAAGCLSTGKAPPTPLPPQPACGISNEPESLCIVILGDSTAEGVPLEGADRWWVQLGDRLRDALPGRPVEIDSWAVPASRIDVLESAAVDQPELASFDIAIVLEGVNDIGHTPLDEWSARYKAVVEQLESKGATVVVTTPLPHFENGAYTARHDALDDAVRSLGGPHRPVLEIARPWLADGPGVGATYYVDTLHVGAAGQRRMADLALDVILRVVEQSAAGMRPL